MKTLSNLRRSLVVATLWVATAWAGGELTEGDTVRAVAMGSLQLLGGQSTDQTLVFRVPDKGCVLIVKTGPGSGEGLLMLQPQRMNCAGLSLDVGRALAAVEISVPTYQDQIDFSVTTNVSF